VVDLTGPNGSASTIDALSNPPSSNALSQTANGRTGESESPVLQMKRHPAAAPSAYTDTPGSHPRNLVALGREPYAMLSSPAAQPLETPLDEHSGQQRWGGIRPLNAGPSAATSAPQARLGTVSVGSGLFSR
jgi:hypothetical protein